MGIQKWRRDRYKNAFDLDKFMTMEIPLSRQDGIILLDTVEVVLIDKSDLLVVAKVGRCDDGYYWALDFETETGGSCCGVCKLGTGCSSKIDAIKAVINRGLRDSQLVSWHNHAPALSRVLEELKRYEYVQLTLF